MGTFGPDYAKNAELKDQGGQRVVPGPPSAAENHPQIMMDKAVRKLALMGIVTALTAMINTAIHPAKVVNYMATLPTFGGIILVMVLVWLLSGFVLLDLSRRENKTVTMSRVQNLVGLAFAVSLTVALCAAFMECMAKLSN